jgi:hypothetical protein
MYAERAIAIFDLSGNLRRRMEMTSAIGTVAAKMAMIDMGVEAVNKLFHFFALGQDLLNVIETKINSLYRKLQPDPSYVNQIFYRLMAVVRQVEKRAAVWVEKCR